MKEGYNVPSLLALAQILLCCVTLTSLDGDLDGSFEGEKDG